MNVFAKLYCKIVSISHSIATTFAKEELSETPPALPPKNNKQWKSSSSASSSSPIPPPTIITTPPPSPKPKHLTSDHRILSVSGGNEMMSTLSEEVGDQGEDDGGVIHSHELQSAYDTSMQEASNSPTLDNMGPNGDYTSEVEEMVNYNNYNRKVTPTNTFKLNHGSSSIHMLI